MGIRSFLSQSSRTLKLAAKPGKTEFWQSTKICFLGISVIGAIGFAIKLLSSVIQSGAPV
ncbi:protein translocase SEC61 complex subunit gamma [Candidatus Bathyarchaeota archaeon]|nr:protein translocase SEC61 complex subunit gamma [Candidatus Bathyarchaeota archaeon]